MEEAGPKPIPDPEAYDDITGKFIGLMADMSPEIPIREELIEEVMQELYREISSNGDGPGVGPGPKSTTVAGSEQVPTTSFDVVIGKENDKSESCGASFSESASTVMAGIEYVAATGRFAGRNMGSTTTMWRESGDDGSYWSWDHGGDDDEVVMMRKKKKGVVEMDGCDRGCDDQEVDDEWLARVLSWGPVELGPWF
ncbi:uncharacterized protein LOC133803708 [Humulus lupulus]|uniref:uncharacterized protein LOC133803708 n=1 Tax=Humulus lupulus TaxID=3486 RepID=UPI002B40BDDC|nr:uncharacterized protein LOC133803708 [Humulus lupulus]